ncbi:MAG: excinuclease ABC subunit UvrC [Anaerovoracaceae bacterium]|jgi:excinuclease UvrABC nuclease subunit
MFNIKENLKKLPDKPGVYLHKDKEGNIIYVGKAISLRNRVRQYFQSPTRLDPKVKAMVSHITEFEYIVTDTEMEALLLESNLIKKYMPKYNVLLRDDKTFPYIKVTLGEEWPRLIKTRRVLDDGSKYFGPYTDASALNQIIDLLSGIYSLKQCGTQNFTEGWKPCLNYHIEKCQGVCSGEADPIVYRQSIEQVINFLNGETKGVLDYLNKRMEDEAEALNFEQAAEYRDQIAAVKAIPDQERLNTFLFNVRRNRVKVIRRKAEESNKKEQEKIKAIKDSWEKIGLYHINRIEAYDISHIAGTDSVGAMVVFKEGKPQRKEYRRFRIKSVSGIADTDSLKEVIYRRMTRGLAHDPGFSILPDIILVDGGRDQVNAVKQVLAESEVKIPVAGMVKDEKHRTRGLILMGKEIDINENRKLCRYITTIQEEVHRFAIEYHRSLRTKRLQKSILDDIPGIGTKRKQALLSYFGSIEKIRDANIEDLQAIPSMNSSVAKKVKEHLNNSVVKNKL